MSKDHISDSLINQLQERAKELNCLYEIQELLIDTGKDAGAVLNGIIQAIPSGWQYPDICVARIIYRQMQAQSSAFRETEWLLESDIVAYDEKVGKVQVYYTEKRPPCDYGPFLKEEQKLMQSIAQLISSYFLHKQLKSVFEGNGKRVKEKRFEWAAVLDILKKTDPRLLIRISQKMVNYLCWKGITESEQLFDLFSTAARDELDVQKESNFPYQARPMKDFLASGNQIFELASKHLGEQEIIDNISRWIKEDQSAFLVNTLNNTGSSFEEISTALARYYHLKANGLELPPNREKSLRIILIRRLLSSQNEFIKTAKKFIELDDIHGLVNHVIHPVDSHGKLGGKSSGLFLSQQILNKSEFSGDSSRKFLVPKTWYITSDGILNFIKYNNLEDIVEQKFKDIEQIRKEYSFVSLVFKNSAFPSEMLKALSQMLDDFADVPLVIRSTSLLEDQPEAIFAGKYKSLFISNQGTKKERLEELTDAIAEVYASTFGPDPMEYRIERGLLDYDEEMGILIQEVVGQRVGPYFFPAFAGVAFSDNNYKWSGRIEKEDGLARLVPGLGTRAVDRLSDDYPVLVAPGKPGLSVNVTVEDIVRYSPKKIDVINLEKRKLETLDIQELLRQHGRDYPAIHQIVSRIADNHIQQPHRLGMHFGEDNYIVTFNGLIQNTDFIPIIRSIMSVLQKELHYPVDIEFAHDGEHFYLLQCRPQSFGRIDKPAEIPHDIPESSLAFTASKHVTNGIVSNISHIVYIDPLKYSELPDYAALTAVGKAVGRLNKILPKRQFILMGPGRWGSRGDIKLGVSVTYSDINNTAMLIEIARMRREYVPELSFGTHFFQDLVEADIRYLPLYPDDRGNIFNESFFKESPNILAGLLPESAHLSEAVKVIDVPACTGGHVLKVLMNAEENKAVALFAKPSGTRAEKERTVLPKSGKDTGFYWRWRQSAAEQLAARLDPERFGVKGVYLFGSAKNATAGLYSDIDLILHFAGTAAQRNDLTLWLEGWGNSLEYIYFLRTGHQVKGLLDIHIVTDKEVEKHTGFAAKIGAITDAARPLAVGTNL